MISTFSCLMLAHFCLVWQLKKLCFSGLHYCGSSIQPIKLKYRRSQISWEVLSVSKKEEKRNEGYWTFWGLFDLENITVSSYSMPYMRKMSSLQKLWLYKISLVLSQCERILKVEIWWVWTLSWYTPARSLRSADHCSWLPRGPD